MEKAEVEVAFIPAYKMVTISNGRLRTLLRSHRFLVALESNGVDNWEGYSDAYREAFPNENNDL